MSLIELLVVIGIIAILLSILAPALLSVRQATRGLLCQTNLHSSSREFQMFADEYSHGFRGQHLPGNRFAAWSFLQSLYGLGEFDDRGGAPNEYAPPMVYPRNHLMVCPSGPQDLVKAARGVPSPYGLVDMSQVSYAMNRRLAFAPVCLEFGGPVEWPVLMDPRVLDHPTAPLMFDVDAQAMMRSDVSHSPYVPLLSAPQGTPSDCSPYTDNAYWFPDARHGDRLMVSLIDGRVVATRTPLRPSGWDWDYHPPIP